MKEMEMKKMEMKEKERIDDEFFGRLISGDALLDAYRAERAKGRTDEDIMRNGLFPDTF